MEGGRQHLEAHRHSPRRAYQVQLPPEKAPLLGGAPAQVCPRVGVGSEQFAAAISAHVLAYREGQAVYDEGFSLREELAYKLGDVLQPRSKGMYSSRKARGAKWLGEVVHVVHHEQGSLMVVVEVHGGRPGEDGQ